MSVLLASLLEGIVTVPATAPRVEDLTLDSRAARPGSLFVALAGRQTHGLAYAAEAAARGATAVLWEPDGAGTDSRLPAQLFAAPVPGLRGVLGRIADRFFGSPSAHLRITAITGTNGKTTCAYLLAQCLERLSSSAAYIGTLGWGPPAALAAPTHTTPDVITLHRELKQLCNAGVRDVAMEVSSHALDQERVAGVRFHTAAFTNLTRDHLDYHGSMTAYGAAKAKLLNDPGLKQLVVNIGDEFGREFAQRYAGAVPLLLVWLRRGGAARADADLGAAAAAIAAAGSHGVRILYGSDVAARVHGISAHFDGSFGPAGVEARLVGHFNAENSLVVIACLLALGIPLNEAAAALAQCEPAPGRMEIIEAAGGDRPTAVIDYAHTPDALEKALRAARDHCAGALWCVFGCGGDRDPGKRAIMGGIAARLADRIIVTDDNPRTEDPQAIAAAIVSGIKPHPVRVIHDRGTAIAAALREAQPSDLVLIAGKGHEDYQIYGETRRRFSDRREARRCLGAAA